MGKKKKRDSKRGSKDNFDWRVQLALPVGVAFVASAISLFGEYMIKTSAINEKCHDLESELKVERARVNEKNEMIADQRSRIALLEGNVLSKNHELSVKENLCEYLKAMYYDKRGTMLTNDKDIVQAMVKTNYTGCSAKGGIEHIDLVEAKRLLTTGTVNDRLGLEKDISPRDFMLKGWEKPLFRDLKPGIFLPTPNGVLECGLSIFDALCTNDIERAVVEARKAHRLLSPVVDVVINKGAEIDVRLSLLISLAYQYVAEDEFCRGNKRRAASLIGTAAGVLGPKPPPLLLARESAMVYRAMEGKCGYYTEHISDAIKYANDEEYTYEIHKELAELGYLQMYLPNKEGTDIGEKIDWQKMFKGKKINSRPTFLKNGDIWSTRWIGLGKYEEYNLSAEFRHLVKTMKVGARNKK